MNVNLNELIRSKEPDQRMLSKLRKLAPNDIHDQKSLNQSCEKQANKLRQLLEVKGNKFPNEAIKKFPNVQIIFR
jgi:hypothetical protein